MRSANLNIMIKSLEKSTSHVSRDFIELENLQSNPASAAKFAEACYQKVKKLLIDDLSKIRPDYNLIFADGQKLIRKENAEYSFIISAIDGFENLLRSNPDFTSSIALEHSNSAGKKEVIAVVILKIVGGETSYCEKGFGAFLNNRRIRVSKRTGSNPVVATSEESLVEEKPVSLRNYGCRTMEIAYVASARIEKAFFRKDKSEFLQHLFLLIKEAGGKISENEKSIVISN
jgi:myo-inositol-1(or 4)-monophosphatase